MVGKAKSRKKGQAADGGAIDISNIPLELRAWYQRTLTIDSTGEYAKLQRSIEFFLVQAERQLKAILWDRATRVALQEALRHMAQKWGPKFQSRLHLEIRVSDTHLKFSVTVPPEAVATRKKPAPIRPKSQQDSSPEKSLYVVRCLMDRIQKAPNGRQVVFRRLLRPILRPLERQARTW